MNQEKIGKFIIERRKLKKLTQQELAHRLGVTDRAISNWENGRRLPDYSLLSQLCIILEITVDELLCGHKLDENERNKNAEKNATKLFSTKNEIENLQILTEILIFVGIIIAMTLTSLIANTNLEKIVTLFSGCFVWGFGIMLRVKLGKAKNKI